VKNAKGIVNYMTNRDVYLSMLFEIEHITNSNWLITFLKGRKKPTLPYKINIHEHCY